MSIEKKSLISTLKTTKKANVASASPSETFTKPETMDLKRPGVGLKRKIDLKRPGMGLKRKVDLKRPGMGLKRKVDLKRKIDLKRSIN